jgi:hypothetical protein
MSSIRHSLILQGLLVPAAPEEIAEARRRTEQKRETKAKSKYKRKLKNASKERNERQDLGASTQNRSRTEASINKVEPLENYTPLPRNEPVLLKLITSLEEPPKLIRSRIRWLVYVQGIYIAGAEITDVRWKIASNRFTQLERELWKMRKYWYSVAYSIKYHPDRDLNGELKKSWLELCSALTKDDGIENEELGRLTIRFLRYHATESKRLENVRRTLASLPRTPSEERGGGCSMLYVKTKAIRRW